MKPYAAGVLAFLLVGWQFSARGLTKRACDDHSCDSRPCRI